MQRTRILFVNHVAQMSGAERGLINTVTRLDHDAFEISVALPCPGPLSEELTRRGAKLRYFDICRLTKTYNPALLLKYFIGWRRGVRQLSALISEVSADIVHANSNTAHIYAGPAAACAGATCIWHCRDLIRLGPLASWMSRHASRIIAISAAVKEHLELGGVPPNKISSIHNVVDTEYFKPSPRRSDTTQIVAMVGQIVPWKNHDMFIRCAALILRSVPRASFQIIGSDLFGEHAEYAESLKSRAESELPGKIQFTGYCSNMPDKLEETAVLLHPAAREPFGRTIIEAMAMKRAVVAINACGPAEIICNGKDGFLVPEGDIEAMAARAVELLSDAALSLRIGEAARSKVEREYSLDNSPEALLSVYRQALSEAAK